MTLNETDQAQSKQSKRSEELLLTFENLLGDLYDVSQRFDKIVHSIVPSPTELKGEGTPGIKKPKRELFIDRLSDKLEKLGAMNNHLREIAADFETF